MKIYNPHPFPAYSNAYLILNNILTYLLKSFTYVENVVIFFIWRKNLFPILSFQRWTLSQKLTYKTNYMWTCARIQVIIISWKWNLRPTTSWKLPCTIHFMKGAPKIVTVFQIFRQKRLEKRLIWNIFEYIFWVQ